MEPGLIALLGSSRWRRSARFGASRTDADRAASRGAGLRALRRRGVVARGAWRALSGCDASQELRLVQLSPARGRLRTAAPLHGARAADGTTSTERPIRALPIRPTCSTVRDPESLVPRRRHAPRPAAGIEGPAQAPRQRDRLSANAAPTRNRRPSVERLHRRRAREQRRQARRSRADRRPGKARARRRTTASSSSTWATARRRSPRSRPPRRGPPDRLSGRVGIAEMSFTPHFPAFAAASTSRLGEASPQLARSGTRAEAGRFSRRCLRVQVRPVRRKADTARTLRRRRPTPTLPA